MRLSASDLETIRQHPQQTKLFLSIFRPRPIFKCRVNNGIAARGDRVVPYDTVTLGSFGLVEAGMTLLVGSADGLRDLGKIRIRSVDGTQFTLAENSDINWTDNLFLTVIRFWEMWPVYPRIIHDPNNNESVVFYKDYDIAYTTQNSLLGTFLNAGPHRAVFRDCSSGLAETYWSSSGTYNNLSGTIAGYQWTFEGGTPSSSSSAEPGTVTYNAPGHYVTRLAISGTAGGVDSTYRYVSVYDYPGCGTGTSPLSWELGSLEGSRQEGGYNINITLHEIVDLNEGDVVVIFAQDWYGSTEVSFGGNSPRQEKIVFSGYVLDDSIRFDYRKSTIDFQAGSITAIMKQAEGFSVSVESVQSPVTWFQLQDMDVKRAMYHYLRWHSTVLNISDFQFVGTDRKIQFYDADRGSLYDAVDSLIRSALLGGLVSDRQGKIWAEVNAYATPNATGTYTPVMELSKRDWMHEPRLEERLRGDVSFIEMGGIAYAGSATGTFSALLSNAPGNAPSYRGKVERIQGLALESQSQLNQLVGNVLANRNARYPTLDEELTGNYRNLDIAPQEAVLIDLQPGDTKRGIRIRNLYTPVSMRWNFDSRNQLFTPSATFNIITSGETGVLIPIPDVPPDEGFSNIPATSGFSSPTFPFGFGAALLSTVDYRIIESGGGNSSGRGISIVSQSTSSVLAQALLRVSSSGIYACFISVGFGLTGGGLASVSCETHIDSHGVANSIFSGGQGGWLLSVGLDDGSGGNHPVPWIAATAIAKSSASCLTLLSANDTVFLKGNALLASDNARGTTLSFFHISMVKVANV